MAKKKKRKEEKKPQKSYYTELYGLFLILLAIIGIGGYGPVGKLISSFAVFLVGTWRYVLLAALLVVGVYLMIKREWPKLFTSKLIGLYIVFVSILIFSHLNYVVENELQGMEILKETVNNFMITTKTLHNISGGGIIGALFSLLFVKCLDVEGAKITAWVLIIAGVVMFTGVSIIDAMKYMKNKTNKIIKHERKPKDDDNKEETIKVNDSNDEEESDNKIVVSSVDELIQANDFKDKPMIKEDASEEPKERVEQLSHGYYLPSIELLDKPKKIKNDANHAGVKENGEIINQVFADFDVPARVIAAHIGPTVTQFEMELKAGTKVSKVLGIQRELALALGAKDIRIQAPIPGKKTIGVETPNRVNSSVSVREILENVPSSRENSKLLVVLGKSIMGSPVFCEIDKTPHLLVAGSTGSGKSVCINSIIISLLMRTKPDEVKLVLVDPKKVEFSMYNCMPHLMAPVVTDPKRASIALKKIVVEMERRYDLFSESGTKNIATYNQYLEKKNEKLSEGEKIKLLPYIVVIIDELADLMLVAAKEVEDSIMRITQMARAAGIHLIVATQRPSTDVITGVVKANIPSRISFAVSSSIDSRTILDMTGAEKLLGKGDMLFLPMGENTPQRVQGTYISDDEIKRVVDYTITQQKASYDESLIKSDEELNAKTMVDDNDYEEPLYNEIVEFVVTSGKASASLLQRRFHLGYNRAARCVDLLEERGIVGPANGSKPREVLVKLENKEE